MDELNEQDEREYQEERDAEYARDLAEELGHIDTDDDFPHDDDGDDEQALTSAGFGMDESYGGEDAWLDGSYEE